MDIFHAIILGIIEGITEFLPISSTGHLVLASHILHIPDTAFVKSFEITIQLGAIGAVLALYWHSFLRIEVLKKLFVAFLPIGIIGLALYKFVKAYLIGNEYVILGALLLGGIAIIIFEMMYKEHEDAIVDPFSISYKQALGVGLFQSIAIIPGVSRSAATIVGGLLLGFRRAAIVEFSFLLAVPTMVAATGLDLLKNYSIFSSTDLVSLGAGFVTAFLVAIIAIRFLLKYIQTHTFISFGIYRIALAIVFLLMFIQ